MRVVKGDRLRARVDLQASGVDHGAHPEPKRFQCRIPRGALLLVDSDPLPGASSFSCSPADPMTEERIVPPEERTDIGPGGHVFVFAFSDVGGRLELVGGPTLAQSRQA